MAEQDEAQFHTVEGHRRERGSANIGAPAPLADVGDDDDDGGATGSMLEEEQEQVPFCCVMLICARVK